MPRIPMLPGSGPLNGEFDWTPHDHGDSQGAFVGFVKHIAQIDDPESWVAPVE